MEHEHKKPAEMSRDELLVTVGRMMASMRKKNKEIEVLQAQLEFYKKDGANRNFQKVKEGTKYASLKKENKGNSKLLKRLNGLMK
jgi:hypothetical protein